MRTFILTAIALLSLTPAFSKGKKCNNSTVQGTAEAKLRGYKFALEYQAFESYDKEGTNKDTVRHQGDYIQFTGNGMAYLNFDGKPDSLKCSFPDKNKVSFGDTPFTITDLGNGFYKLFQNEEASDGTYNRVTYLLKREAYIVSNLDE